MILFASLGATKKSVVLGAGTHEKQQYMFAKTASFSTAGVLSSLLLPDISWP